jgi:hypothetical protein
MYDFLTQHQSWAALIAYWIFSAAVSSMPDPGSNDKPGYLWLYRFCHTTAGNISNVVESRLSRLKILLPLVIVPLLFSTTACAAVHYTVHPGALNRTDSVVYDTLLIAEKLIDQTRADYQSGLLTSDIRDRLNTLIRSYNVARESWLTYRGAISNHLTADTYFAQLTQNVADLSAAIRQVKEGK